MNFEEEIISLIEKKKEGSYWDFKQQWYDSNHHGDLLHDIICMANNQSKHDAFIIIGIEDKSFRVVGVENDPNRKNTVDLLNFLREKKFAGEVRPSVNVNSIFFQGRVIDVILIENSNKTPFYLVSRFKQVKENSIYVRNEDSNTPIDKTADPDKIEYLWRKRLGIDLPAVDRFEILITEKDKWKKSPFLPENSPYFEIWYHEIFPEFTIKISEDKTGNAQELYMAECRDPTPFWLNIYICYHNTVLSFFKGVALDGGRSTIISPHPYASISRKIDGNPLMFHYYLKNSLELKISNILGGLSLEDNAQGIIEITSPVKSILCFEDQNEWSLFKEKYLELEEIHFEKLTDLDIKEISEKSIKGICISPEVHNKKMLNVHAKFTTWIQKKLEEFRCNR